MTRDDGFDVDMKNIEIADYPRVPDADYEAVCFKAEGPTKPLDQRDAKYIYILELSVMGNITARNCIYH